MFCPTSNGIVERANGHPESHAHLVTHIIPLIHVIPVTCTPSHAYNPTHTCNPSHICTQSHTHNPTHTVHVNPVIHIIPVTYATSHTYLFFSSVYTVEEPEGQVPPNSFTVASAPTTQWLAQDMVLKGLHTINVNKAPGPDGIHPWVLRELGAELQWPLFLIFSDSLSSGMVPRHWKKANVIPIFKKEVRSQPGNYRPVNLTSVVGKLFEGLLRDHIQNYVVENGIMSSNQHGFRKDRSCQTNLIAFYDEVSKKLDSGDAVDIIYLDFAKAFDTVPHKRLLSKLRSIGLSEVVCTWIENWLQDRVQRVVVNGTFSTWNKVLSGVPQGSVLGPLLFNLFINDLGEGIMSNVFADDTKLCRPVNSIQDVTSLQQDLDQLAIWAAKWQMRFNVDKCKVMHLGCKNMQTHIPLMGLH
uniref:Reverse transcriptase domain-containing protein n=1 Tax=Xenopus tropicalis TaxID=8364 RepID=A0A803J7Q1_XENTR